MKRIALIAILLLSSLAAFAQWGDDAWKAERTVEMPGVIKEDLYARAERALQAYNPEDLTSVIHTYGHTNYNRCIKVYNFHFEIQGDKKKYKFDPLAYDFAIFCYDGYYTVAITGIMTHLAHGPSYRIVPLDNTGLSKKEAAMFDALRSYLTDELEWQLPTIKRRMAEPVPGWRPPISAY